MAQSTLVNAWDGRNICISCTSDKIFGFAAEGFAFYCVTRNQDSSCRNHHRNSDQCATPVTNVPPQACPMTQLELSSRYIIRIVAASLSLGGFQHKPLSTAARRARIAEFLGARES